jgi:protein-tyrosine kinase
MSRIDEALRRAAREQGAGEPSADDTSTPLPLDGADVATLAREPFPIELAAARRAHVRPDASTAQPDSAVGREQQSAQEPDHRKTLFERIDARLAEKVVADENMSPVSREQYRRLAAVLHDAQGNNGMRVVMIASAVAGEGKTLTATNVALTLSDSYHRRVLLIDADLRKPALHEVFRLNTTSGLIDGIEAQTDVKLVVRQVSSYLWVLPAGRPTSDPMAGLTSDRMRQLLDEAKATFDWVIIDTPPLMTLPDAHLLSLMVDGAIVVVRANSTRHDLVKRTVEIIGRDRVTGVVLNQAEAVMHSGYDVYEHHHYYLAAAKDAQGQ